MSILKHKKRAACLLAGFLLLAACAAPAMETAAPTPSVEGTANPEPIMAPEPVPSPEEPKELWGFPIDDTHDAFEVPTGGKLGTVLVTVEMAEGDHEFIPPATLSVWDPADLAEPIQVAEVGGFTHRYELLDANFDGYMDLCYTWCFGAANENDSLWVWDETAEKFIYVEDFLGDSLTVDEEAELIYTHTHGSIASGEDGIFRWEDGDLVCARLISICCSDPSDGDSIRQLLTVEDNIDGEMIEVYRDEFNDPGGEEIYHEVISWYDLSCHGK